MFKRSHVAALALLGIVSLAQAAPDQPPPPPAPVDSTQAGPADSAPAESSPVFVQPLTAKEAAEPPKSARQKQAEADEKAIGKSVAATAAAMLHIGLFATYMLMMIFAAGVVGGIAAAITAFVRSRRIAATDRERQRAAGV